MTKRTAAAKFGLITTSAVLLASFLAGCANGIDETAYTEIRAEAQVQLEGSDHELDISGKLPSTWPQEVPTPNPPAIYAITGYSGSEWTAIFESSENFNWDGYIHQLESAGFEVQETRDNFGSIIKGVRLEGRNHSVIATLVEQYDMEIISIAVLKHDS